MKYYQNLQYARYMDCFIQFFAFSFCNMADWTAVKEQADDLIALYTSRTSSQIRMKDNHESQIWFPQTPGHADGETTFCTSDNLQSCLTFLDQVWLMNCFPCIHLHITVEKSHSVTGLWNQVLYAIGRMKVRGSLS